MKDYYRAEMKARWREKASGSAGRLGDEKVERPRRPQARESVIVDARWVKRFGQPHRVAQHRPRQPEVLLRLLEDVLLAASPERRAANLLRFAQRHRTGRVQVERLGAVQSCEQIDDVVERAHHVRANFLFGQIPAAFFLDEVENSLPRFRVGNVDHPAKDPSVGWRAEYRRAQNSIEMFVGMLVVAKNQLLCGPAESLADVHVEAALPKIGR